MHYRTATFYVFSLLFSRGKLSCPNNWASFVKGTFDGYVTDTKTANGDSVKVSGSFNISQ